MFYCFRRYLSLLHHFIKKIYALSEKLCVTSSIRTPRECTEHATTRPSNVFIRLFRQLTRNEDATCKSSKQNNAFYHRSLPKNRYGRIFRQHKSSLTKFFWKNAKYPIKRSMCGNICNEGKALYNFNNN